MWGKITVIIRQIFGEGFGVFAGGICGVGGGLDAQGVGFGVWAFARLG